MFNSFTIENYRDSVRETLPLRYITDVSTYSNFEESSLHRALVALIGVLAHQTPVKNAIAFDDSHGGHYPVRIILEGDENLGIEKRNVHSKSEMIGSLDKMRPLVAYYAKDCMPKEEPMEFPFRLQDPETGYFGATAGVCNTSLVLSFLREVGNSMDEYGRFIDKANELWQSYYSNRNLSIDFPTISPKGVEVTFSKGLRMLAPINTWGMLFIELLARAYILNGDRKNFNECTGIVLIDDWDYFFPYRDFEEMLKDMFPNVQFIFG